MCEFVGLDLEMSIKEHYFEVLEYFGELLPFMFEQLAARYADELKAINEQYPFTPFKCKYPVVKITFEEGIQLLKENGVEWPADEDLSTEVERKLGECGNFDLIQSRKSMTLTSTCCTDIPSQQDLSIPCFVKTTLTILALMTSS